MIDISWPRTNKKRILTMNNLDKQIISLSLESLGLKLLSCHSKVEEDEETIRKYIPIIVKESIKNRRGDVIKSIIDNGLITIDHFYFIASRNN